MRKDTSVGVSQVVSPTEHLEPCRNQQEELSVKHENKILIYVYIFLLTRQHSLLLNESGSGASLPVFECWLFSLLAIELKKINNLSMLIFLIYRMEIIITFLISLI